MYLSVTVLDTENLVNRSFWGCLWFRVVLSGGLLFGVMVSQPGSIG